MRRIPFVVVAAALIFSQAASSAPAPSPWRLMAAPNAYFPLTSGDFGPNELFSPSWGGSLAAELDLRTAAPLALRLGAGYSSGGLRPAEGIRSETTLNEASLLAGAGIGLPLGRTFRLGAFVDGGLGFGALSSGTSSAYGLLRAGGGLDMELGRISARAELSWAQKLGLTGGLGLSLGFGYRLPGRAAALPVGGPRLLEIEGLELDEVFPVLRSTYDERPLGRLRIKNAGKEAATEIRVSFLARQYMDAPKECGTIARLEPGRTAEVDILALFNDSILNVTEATKAGAEISLEYRDASGAGPATLSRGATVLVYDRNALTWKDDRIAAAFVSSKDPWVLDLTGNFLAAVKGSRNAELPANLQVALAVHEGLRVYGLAYMKSPNRPFAQAVVDTAAVDSLRYPRQTLGFRSGDCADLSVLYASCLEAAGIETAFVTVPGHVFMALDLGLSPAEAAARAMDSRELIIQDGRAWLPIETTLRDAGYMEVWRKAAAQWRSAFEKGSAALYPLHEAWKTYPPIGLPADGSSVSPPAGDLVLKAFRAELARAVEAELGLRIKALGDFQAKGRDLAKRLNDRGVLYGRYGRLDEAERDFKAAAKDDFPPAIVNLGNIAYLRGDIASALSSYQKAAKLSPSTPAILVNIARSAAALGKTDVAAAAFERLQALDPATAARNAALAQAAPTGAPGTRAAELGADGPEWL